MKPTKKEKSLKTTDETQSQSLTIVRDPDNSQLDGKNQNQLIEKIEVENTPFLIIHIENDYFGTFGQYRITEIYNTPEQCKKDLENITWNNLVKVMTLVVEMLNNKK